MIQQYVQNDLEERVVLVTEQDKHILGPDGKPMTAPKLYAHKKGLLHRAFSVVIYDVNGHMLIQQRSMDKYHGKGEWANAACGHPRLYERVADAARRRLNEEMGIDVPKLNTLLKYKYRVEMKEGLIEHEFLHVLVGEFNGFVYPNKSEVMNHTWMYPEAIDAEIKDNPAKYAFWFKRTMNELYEKGKIKRLSIP